MKKNTQTPLLFCVSRSRFLVYVPETQQLVASDVPAEILHDLEIASEELLHAHLIAFFTAQQLKPRDVVMVLLDSVIFSQVLTHVNEGEEKEQEERAFLLTVPLESKYFKEIKVGKASQLVCVGRKLYQPLLAVMSALSYHVMSIFAPSVFSFSVAEEALTPELCAQMLKEIPTLPKESNLLTPEEEKHEGAVTDINEPSHKREMILVGIFVFLLICLGVVYFMSQRSVNTPVPTPTPLPAVTQRPIPTVVASSTPVPAVASSSAATATSAAVIQDRSTWSIQVVNGSGTAGQGSTIRNLLTGLGYTSVNVTAGPVTTAAQTDVVFAPSVPQAVRSEIVGVISDQLGEVRVQERDGQSAQITITTHQSTQ